MKTIKQLIILLCLTLAFFTQGFAQDSTQFGTKAPTMKFFISGDAFMGLRYTPEVTNSGVTTDKTFTFTNMGVNPVLVWKLSNRMLFEGEVEFQNRNPAPTGYAAGEGLEVELEYANIGYFINDYLIIRAGTFFSSMGIFEDWYHQRITNRMTSRPLGIGAGNHLETGSELGFNFRGGVPIGSAKLTYSVDLTTGPRLITEDNAEEGVHAGQLEWEGITDNNLNKSIGARVSILPISNSSLEIGVSGQTAKLGDSNSDEYKDVSNVYLGADLSYNKDIDPIKGTIIFRSQFASENIDDANYPIGEDSSFTFDNKSSAWYLQLSYRPTMLKSKVIRRAELCARYCSLNNPEGSTWGNDKTQFGMTLDYWIKWNAVVKLGFEQDVNHPDSGTAKKIAPRYLFQLAMGF